MRPRVRYFNTAHTRHLEMHYLTGMMGFVALSQVRLVPGEDDAKAGGELFPARALDADGQQIDLRPKNTWSARAHEVSCTRANS
jgi:hypothetical protein